MPVDLIAEDPLYPLTSFAKVGKENRHYATIKHFMEQVRDLVKKLENAELRDLNAEFLIDLFGKLWLVGLFSEEYADRLKHGANNELDRNKTALVQKMAERLRSENH